MFAQIRARAAAATSRAAPRVSARTKTCTGPRVAFAMVRPPATASTSVLLCIRPPFLPASRGPGVPASRRPGPYVSWKAGSPLVRSPASGASSQEGGSALLEVADEPDDVIRDEPADSAAGVDTDQDATLGVQHKTSGLQVERVIVDEGAGCLGHLASIGAMADRKTEMMLRHKVRCCGLVVH